MIIVQSYNSKHYLLKIVGKNFEKFKDSFIFAPLFTKTEKSIGSVGEWLKPPVC